MKILSPSYALLRTIFAFNRINKAPYSIVAPLTFRTQLSTYHGINIGRAMTFRYLQWLEANGYIWRQQRWANHEHGHIKRLPSLFYLTAKAIKLFVKEKITGAGDALQNIYDYLKNKDGRGPNRDQLTGDVKPRDCKGVLTRIKDLLPQFA